MTDGKLRLIVYDEDWGVEHNKREGANGIKIVHIGQIF